MPSKMDSRDPSHSRSHSLSREHPRIKDRFWGVEESVKRWRESESPSSHGSESSTSNIGHWKSRTKRRKLVDEDDLAVPWICEDVDPFTPRINNFKSLRKTCMPNNVKTYDGTGDPEDHLKIFQAATQVERWEMPTWCHMFNSTLIGAVRVWFDELPPESIDGYKGLKAAFLAHFMQQKKYVKDPVEIHNIKQRDGETIVDFMKWFKVKTGRMKGAPECIRISRFMHGVNNPELTKHLNEHVPKTMEEMMTVTTAFIRGEAAVASKKKGHLPWKSQDESKRHASERKSDFRGHSTDECMQLKKQIEELVRVGKLSHLIKEIKQGRDQTKKEARAKDKSLAIYMIQPWQRMTRQKLTQSFARGNEIMFPPLANSDGIEGLLVIEAVIGGHMIHRMYIDGGSSTEVLYEHCFNQLRPEIKNQMVPATTSLTGFSGETIWPLGQLRLLVTIGDADHSTKAWMNFMIVRSLSPYNGIIRRHGIREIQAIPSTAHGMLKFPANGGIVTIRSTILIPAECTTVITSSKEVPKEAKVRPKNFKIALHPNFPDQEVAIRGTLSAEGRTKLRIFACLTEEKGAGPEMYKGDPSGARKEPDKTEVVLQLPSPRTIKEVQSLNGKLARLNRFLSKSAENSLPLFKTLKKCIKKSEFNSTPEVEQAFKQLKQHLSELPLLVAPKPKEELIVYLAASHGAISAVLMTERDTIQTPVYFVSRTLQGPELNYSPMEKLVLSLVFTAKRLQRYFQAHPIAVIIDQPIKQIMSRPDVAGRLQKWSVMLGEHNITYWPRTSMKGQILAHFLVEKPGENLSETPAADIPQEPWILFTDGSSCIDGSGVGLILTSPEGTEFTYALRFQFTSSNNKAEYEALIAGLQITAHIRVRNVHAKYHEKSIHEEEVAMVVEEEGTTWMTPIIEYLKDGTLPGNRKEASKLRIKAREYELLEGILYKRSFLKPWLRCVGQLQADYVI
ncbi:reverse transcriptase domain-containing protein [Tanacetum coccineum]